MLVSVDKIRSEGNVRLDDPETSGLLSSMNVIGQITPITIREDEDGFVVIAGHRRLAAAQELGWKEIEAYVIDSNGSTLAMQIAENVSRNDLKPYELAQGVLALQVESGMNQKAIANALGLSTGEISQLQKIAKGTAGLDPSEMNQLTMDDLIVYQHVHDMPAAMREGFIDAHNQGQLGYWEVNAYIEDVQKWRWTRKKENRPLIKALEDIGAVEITREQSRIATHLTGEKLEAHRGEPCHAWTIVRSWSGNDQGDYAISEYCLDPESHEESPSPVLAEMATEEAQRPEAFDRAVSAYAVDKARRARKVARKEAVLNFTGKPRMRELTQLLYLFVLNTQREYKWQELGKTFGLVKDEGSYHYDWDDYLSDFEGKDKLVQQLSIAIGSWYVALEGTYSGSDTFDLLEKLDELFGAAIEHEGDDTEEE